MQNANVSIVMNGIKKCSGSCLYCSAASTMDYRAKDNKNTFKFYPDKLKAKILEYCEPALSTKEPVELNVDIWGGNPLENFDPFKKVVDFCENNLKEFKSVRLHTSGNGLELRDNDLKDFLVKHNIRYQLSHDGLGQWIRTGEIDPLYWEKTKDNIADLARRGILDWINCTLSSRNPSFFDNIDYWNKWRKEIGLDGSIPLTIKLNHIYDGTPPITKKWLGADNKYIKHGEEIGDLNFHGEVLQNYLSEFRKLAIICKTPGIRDNWTFAPFVSYIAGQADRYTIIQNDNQLGACVRFQRGISDKNFAIDTKGKYCQCNLIDSDNKVKNSKAEMPEYCNNCKYKKTTECNTCGSENFPEKCEYKWWWNKTLEEMFSLNELIKYMNNKPNNTPQHQCSCKGKSENNAVFCVKNFAF